MVFHTSLLIVINSAIQRMTMTFILFLFFILFIVMIIINITLY